MSKELTIKEKEQASLTFFKEAFCVDGDARFVSPKNYKIVGAIELTDSKRGTFVVGRLENITTSTKSTNP